MASPPPEEPVEPADEAAEEVQEENGTADGDEGELDTAEQQEHEDEVEEEEEAAEAGGGEVEEEDEAGGGEVEEEQDEAGGGEVEEEQDEAGGGEVEEEQDAADGGEVEEEDEAGGEVEEEAGGEEEDEAGDGEVEEEEEEVAEGHELRHVQDDNEEGVEDEEGAQEANEEGEEGGEEEEEDEEAQTERRRKRKAEIAKQLKVAIVAYLDKQDINTVKLKNVRKALSKDPAIGKTVVKKKRKTINQICRAEILRRQEEGETGGGQDDEEEEEPEEAEDDEEYHEKKKKKKRLQKKSKSTSKRKKAADGGPKRNMGAYMHFSKARRQQVKDDNPELSGIAEIGKEMGRLWREMTKEDKEPYEAMAKEDKERYLQWERDNPELAAARQADKKANRKAGKRAPKSGDKKPSKRRKKTVEDKEALLDDGFASEDKDEEKSYMDTILDDIKQEKKRMRRASRRNKIDLVADQNAQIFAENFTRKMEEAALQDMEDKLNNKPAVHKMLMLTEVVRTCEKKDLQEVLLDKGLLRVITLWLKPHQTGDLPSLRVRTDLYNLLFHMVLDESHLTNSQGLGEVVIGYWRHKEETTENKRLLENLIQKWMRPIYGLSTSYHDLGAAEDARKCEVIRRKKALGYKGMFRYPSKQAQSALIPSATAFDYAIRPQSAVGAEDLARVKDIKRRKSESFYGRLDRKMIQSSKRAVPTDTVDVSGKKIT